MAEMSGRRRATAAAVGWGVLVGLTVMFAACSGTSGTMTEDEPPIRVRGGSIQIDLLGGGFEFEEDSPKDKKNWKIRRDPPRGRDTYTVAIIRQTDDDKCRSQVFSTPRLQFVYSASDQVVTFTAGNSTRVKSDQPLTQPRNYRLEYTVGGYIRAIKKGTAGEDVCTLDKADTSLRVYLLD